MKCRIPKEKLNAYVDKALSPEESKIIEDHLKSCPGCRLEISDIRSVKNIMSGVEEIKRSPAFWDTLYLRIMQKLDYSTEKVFSFTRRKLELAIGFAFIVLFALVVIWKNPFVKDRQEDLAENLGEDKELELLLQEHDLSAENSIIPEFTNMAFMSGKDRGKK